MSNLALSLKAYSEVLLHCDDPPKGGAPIAHYKEMDMPEDTTPLKVVRAHHGESGGADRSC